MKTPFEQTISEKMKDHEVHVSPQVWKNIKPKSSKAGLLLFSKRIAIACVIFLFGSVIGYQINNQETPVYVEIDKKPLRSLQINEFDVNELIFGQMELPTYKKISTKNERKSDKLELQIHFVPEITEPESESEPEIIVLNIKPRKRNWVRRKLVRKASSKQQIQIDSENLLVEVEKKIKINSKKEFNTYLTDIRKLASKEHINNSLASVETWINNKSKKVFNNKKRKK